MTLKKIIAFLAVISSVFMAGCWNYRSLSDMSIVSGMAVDKNPDSGDFRLSFEILDTAKPIKEQGVRSKTIISEGRTFFDAARNAKQMLHSKLYFGHMEIAVISEEIAKSGDLGQLLDWFLRDIEFRETLNIVVAKGIPAHDILQTESVNQPIVSYEIQRIIKQDSEITASTVGKQLYELYNELNMEGISPVLPAVQAVKINDKKICRVSGCAVFKGIRLAGYLTPEETKYYLYAVDEAKGGLLTFPADGEGKDSATLEVIESKTKASYKFKNEKIKFRLEPKLTTLLDEINKPLSSLDDTKIKKLEKNAEACLSSRILSVIRKVQREFGSDIFGFGNMIYKKDPKLWKKLSKDWNEIFAELPVETVSSISITNTSWMDKTEGL